MANIEILSENIDYDLYTFKLNKSCYYCLSQTNINFNTYICQEQICVKTCLFCNIITNYKKIHTGKVILCHSTLSQLEIIKKTQQYYKEFNTIPLLIDIDSKVQIISISSYIFAKLLLTQDKSIFKNYVFFFTSDITQILNNNSCMFGTNTKPKIKHINMYYSNIPKYIIPQSEQNIIDNFIINITNDNNIIINANKKIINSYQNITTNIKTNINNNINNDITIKTFLRL